MEAYSEKRGQQKSDHNFRRNRFKACGVGRDRTGDTRIFSPLLYRLSYRTFAKASARKAHHSASPAEAQRAKAGQQK
jgi:hypothetical protein